MLKRFVTLFKIILVLVVGISIFGAVKYFKEQYNNKNNKLNNYTVYEKNEKSNLEKVQDGLNDLYERNIKKSDNESDENLENGENIDNNTNDNLGFLNKAKNKIKGAYNNISQKISNRKNNKDNKTDDEYDSKKYNTYNFDPSILMFEGENKGKSVIDLLSIIIKNANDDLFTNTTVIYKNSNSDKQTIDYSYSLDNKTEYISKLENIKNSINKDDDYIISFGYNKLKTHVEEVIIEKK